MRNTRIGTRTRTEREERNKKKKEGVEGHTRESKI
jgi:hypothetical protein